MLCWQEKDSLESSSLMVANQKAARVVALQAERPSLPASYTSNSRLEAGMLAYAQAYAAGFARSFPSRPPLWLTPKCAALLACAARVPSSVSSPTSRAFVRNTPCWQPERLNPSVQWSASQTPAVTRAAAGRTRLWLLTQSTRTQACLLGSGTGRCPAMGSPAHSPACSTTALAA